MEDETLKLYEKIEELTVQVTEIKTLLTETVIVNQRHNMERLDRHRRDINKAFFEIEEIKATIENTKGKFITTKNILVGLLGLIATCTTIAVGVTQIILNSR